MQARHASPLGDERGQATVELALVIPILLLILFGIIDFARALNTWNNTTNLANIGARAAVVVGTSSSTEPSCGGSTSTLIAYVQCEATNDAMTSSNVHVCVADVNGSTTTYGTTGVPLTVKTGDQLKIKVTYPYSWIPFIAGKIGATTSTIGSTAVMRVEQDNNSTTSAWFEGDTSGC